MDTATMILVADDEPRMRGVLVRTLAARGYHVCEAEDGDSALAVLRKEKNIAAVILDIRMPGINGLETFDNLKKEFPGVKIIVSSVYPEDEQKFFIDGADAYFLKTDDVAHLAELVSQVCCVKQGGGV